MPTNSKPSDRADKAEQDPPATDSAPEQKADTKPPQAWEYTAPFSTVYTVPLTAHPAIPAREATDDDPGEPAQPATVFVWPDGAPDDRWKPTSKAPNQRPDNEPAQPTEAQS